MNESAQTADAILIVDREHIMCELLKYRFENEGFSVEVEHDGHKALGHDLTRYSIILVDLMGSEFDGLMFTRTIKSGWLDILHGDFALKIDGWTK